MLLLLTCARVFRFVSHWTVCRNEIYYYIFYIFLILWQPWRLPKIHFPFKVLEAESFHHAIECGVQNVWCVWNEFRMVGFCIYIGSRESWISCMHGSSVRMATRIYKCYICVMPTREPSQRKTQKKKSSNGKEQKTKKRLSCGFEQRTRIWIWAQNIVNVGRLTA